MATSPSIFVALLIFCSARNTAYVCDLHPASSNVSVRLVSFRMDMDQLMVSAYSRPSHCSFIFREFNSVAP